MNEIVPQDIINSATPLENGLAGIHPRLYAFESDFQKLRKLVRNEPYASMLRRTRQFTDSFPADVDATNWKGDLRTSGDLLASLALLWKITLDPKYLAGTRALMRSMVAIRNWGIDLDFGHLGHGTALAWDWLYHDLPKTERNAVADALAVRCDFFFKKWAAYDLHAAFAYTWNHMAVPLTGLTAIASALYGERPRIARWIKMAMEKTRLMTDSFGPDGLSPEGTAYGQYHAEYLARTAMLINGLAGVDFIGRSTWWRNYPEASLYLTFPRAHWQNKEVFFMLGDADRHHWLGPDPILRLCAKIFRDGTAQWLADELHKTNSSTNHSAFLNLLWHDPTVKALPPRNLPKCRHFPDQDIVVMRSAWDGKESVLVFACGPHSGWHNRNYNHNVSGGHQHPIAGAVVLYAHGDLLLVESGYPHKLTAFENTLLVNNKGQIGEGASWFEDLEFRKDHPAPGMLASNFKNDFSYAIGDATNAYPAGAHLKRFIRHIYCLARDHWLIVDELEAERPVRFSLLFHGDNPFSRDSETTFLQTCKNGALRLRTLAPTQMRACLRIQKFQRLGHPDCIRSLGLLELSVKTKTRKTVFVTHLHAFQAKHGPDADLVLRKKAGRSVLILDGRNIKKSFAFNMRRKDISEPVIRPI